MSKSIKYNNVTFDSSTISHKRRLLSSMINDSNIAYNIGLPTTLKIQNADFNVLQNYGTGFLIAQGPCLNGPNNNGLTNWHWYVLQFRWSAEYIVQIAISVHTISDKVYIRHKIADNWGKWWTVTLT